MQDSTQRFTNRVENYLKYRPRYPAEIISVLESAGVLRPDNVIADLGSGTGFLAELFLARGYHVYGVEPNDAMRHAGEEHLATYSRFRSVNATAENTTLPGASVDLVTAGQALHWFDIERTRAEIIRISRAPHWFAIATNDRDKSSSPFMADYDAVLHEYTDEYVKVRNLYREEHQFEPVFGHTNYYTAQLAYRQDFDEAGLIGRVLSSSYAPPPGQPGHEELVAALKRIFQAHQTIGTIQFIYRSLLIYGSVK